MTRLYCNFPLVVGTSIDLPKDIARHILVLRLNKGKEITLFNGQGGEYIAQILKINRSQTLVEILSYLQREVELPYEITLAQALPEAGKMDWIVEKTVELGVHQIIPIAAQRSVIRLNAERAEKRVARWQAIIIAASEQSGRNTLPRIAEPIEFNKFIEKTSEDLRIMFSPRSTVSLASWTLNHNPQAVTLMIGPEGGFSAKEEELAIKSGIISLSMGPRILRTETAGLAAISAITALWGDK